jgi:RNA polymerase sigma-70 factor (ECF subfamily)
MAGSDQGRELAEVAFRQHGAQIYRFLLRRSGNHHDAEELTQRVFADASVALKAGKAQPDSLLAWLYAVAERRFIDEVRRRVVARRNVGLLPRAEDAPDLIYPREVARALKEAIERLPEDQRTVVVLKVFEGRRFAEIAEILGTTEAACKMRLSRAIAKMKNELNEQGIEL